MKCPGLPPNSVFPGSRTCREHLGTPKALYVACCENPFFTALIAIS